MNTFATDWHFIKMGKFYYNRLRNNRIKAISSAIVVIMSNVLLIYAYQLKLAKEDVNLFYVVTISFGTIGFLYVLGLISFGQVIEKDPAGQIATYYKLGKNKLKYRTRGQITGVYLDQDSNKYYCLKINTSAGRALIIEKHPTFNQANQRLEELRTALM